MCLLFKYINLLFIIIIIFHCDITIQFHCREKKTNLMIITYNFRLFNLHDPDISTSYIWILNSMIIVG